ncbi:MAG: 1,4-alpha-glucan branching protein GlgB [Firmicutes bacterium]|nr:1,4-alpha-glucan branching protein GlgB [Bacillota bacterium]
MTDKKLTPYDLYLFNQGTHYTSYRKLGAHPIIKNKEHGILFSVWAPNAKEVRVVGDFNNWNGGQEVMKKLGQSGIWSHFIPDIQEGEIYKYEIVSQNGEVFLKSDPYAFYSELRPKSASIVYPINKYKWEDNQWQQNKKNNHFQQPITIYEVHLDSWKRGESNKTLTFKEFSDQLIDYTIKMGYTHLEILPIAEHPYDGSWGYQSTGYYSVTSRYGTPLDFMNFIDKCHKKGIGVILDWVPGHFCNDGHGLIRFDGSALYESDNPFKSTNEQWGTTNFDFSKPEVWSYLISNAIFWMDMFHIDGIRVDAVANMLYLDYGKETGQWVPNEYGGNENLDAVAFIKRLNEVVFKYFPDNFVIAEESTTWPMVTMPTYLGGLGFSYKWNMGWMNDVLKYMQMDPVYRKWHHNLLTFSFMYTYSENYILPLSHDEVVHGKKSLLNKMPGDYWQKFANLRLLYAYMISHPGKKLMFMGGEFGQFIEWRFDQSLDWHLLNYEMHKKLHKYCSSLNHLYQKEKCLWEADHDKNGFLWIDPHNNNQSVITFMRRGNEEGDIIIIVCNFTPVVYENYRIGVPFKTNYIETFNSDLDKYGGSDVKNKSPLMASDKPWHNQPYSVELKIPPLAAVYLKPY